MAGTAPIILAEVRSDALALQTEWIAKSDALLIQAKAITAVSDDASLNLAGGLLADSKKHLNALEKARKDITGPLDAIKKAIMDQERTLGGPLAVEVNRLQAASNKYATEKAYAAEQARRKAEQDAAEAQRKADIEAEARRAKAAAVFGAEAAQEMVPPPPPIVIPAAPLPQAPKAEGARMVTRWSFRVVDVQQVPREFLTVNEVAIRAWMNAQLKMYAGKTPVLAGVEFISAVCVDAGR